MSIYLACDIAISHGVQLNIQPEQEQATYWGALSGEAVERFTSGETNNEVGR